MRRTITLLVVLIFVNVSVQDDVKAKLNGTVTLKFQPAPMFERFVFDQKTGHESVQIYRVCNGKNAAKCGYWESTETKKKIASATTYDKSKKLMTIKNFKNSDAGEYFSITYHSVSIPKNGG